MCLNFGTRVQEHSGSDKKPLVYNHLRAQEHFNYVINLPSLPPSNNLVQYLEYAKLSVYDNTKIIDISQNWESLNFRKPSHQMKEAKTELRY